MSTISERRYIIAVLDGIPGGPHPGATITDSDLWGLYCAVQHALDSSYLKDNETWALAMLRRIRRLHGMEK